MLCKGSDYIVEYLTQLGISDVFGYPGGMVTHLMDSLQKYDKEISAHLLHHEQAVAFAACGYAQTTGKIGVAYATSGPGATNLITGICHAYFDSIPVLFLTGQVNTFESNATYGMRQRGFQETDIVSMVQPVVKYAAYVSSADELKRKLSKAVSIALDRRKGPVLLDIPMDVQRTMFDPDLIPELQPEAASSVSCDLETILSSALESAQRPCILIGQGVYSAMQKQEVRDLLHHLQIPIVTSMLAFDIAPDDLPIGRLNFGFIGAYGDRCANFVVAKSDLVITLGARLDVRQVGAKRNSFAPDATILRIDIDEKELAYPIHANDINCRISISDAIAQMKRIAIPTDKFGPWVAVCRQIKEKLCSEPLSEPLSMLAQLSKKAPPDCIVTGDVGQNQVWIAQAFAAHSGQQFLIPGGHSAMGCSLPVAIGAFWGSRRTVLSISGDGGIQMSIHELQAVFRDQLPVKIIVLNNQALGMIRHFQEMYFQQSYVQTVSPNGYSAPDFCAIASAYGLRAKKVSTPEAIEALDLCDGVPELIEVVLTGDTYVFPKLEFGKPNQDQEPLIDRALYDELMSL
jgi:acetolactate synthase-1/2/3 large subunit